MVTKYKRIKLTAKTVDEGPASLNVGSLEKRSNQPKYKEPKRRSPKTTAKLIQNNVYCFFMTIFRLAMPAFFTDVTELMYESQYQYQTNIPTPFICGVPPPVFT